MRRHIITGFMAAELDPHLDGRIDTEPYAYGLAVCENWVCINEGPLVKRQGFIRVADADTSSTWLSAFRRSIEQEYLLEWGEAKVRFFADEQRLEDSPGVAYEVTTPYTAAQAPHVSREQSFDRLYCDHGEHPPSALRRDAFDTFTFETIENLNGPFLDTNTDETRTVVADVTTGTVTLTGSAGFDAGHNGALFRLEAKDFADIPQWEPGMKNVSLGDEVRNRGKVYEAVTTGTTGSVEPEHTEGSFFDGQLKDDLLNDKGPYGVKWSYKHDRFGIVEITNVVNATSAVGVVKRRLPDSLTSVASHKWAHSAFSAAEGWPHLVTTFKGRQVHFKELDVIGSVAGDYGGGRVNYAAFTDAGRIEADLAFRRTVGFSDPPLWVSADRSLLVGTASLEMAIGPTNTGAAFSGTNIEAEAQSFYGSELVFPIKVGTETIFIERGGRRCRSADYDFGRDRYDAVDLNSTSRHITQGGVVQLGYQRVPHALAYGVRGDGQMIVHAKTRADVRGFSRWKLGGSARALSAVSVVGSDGKTDDIWLLVERDNGAGASVKEIWRQAPWRELGDDHREAFYVDGGVRIAMLAGANSVSGLDYLAEQEVTVLANGVVVPGLTVASDGTLTLPARSVPSGDYTLIVGLGYTATATTMRPELRDGKGRTAGLRQRIVKAVTRVLETLGLQLSAPGSPPEEVTLRRGGQPMDEQIPLFSGDTDGLVDAEFDREGRVTWVSAKPLPATITLAAMNMEVSVADA
ncbi:MAG: hypothetical protein AAGE86_05770 [Pseudomonadota bacterium]